MKARTLSILFSALAGAVLARTDAEISAPGEGPLYVIPFNGVVDKSLLYIVRRGLMEAEQEKASGIILRMDTPGGRVDIMEEIVQRLLRSAVRTYTFVEKDAMSAGAIIALGTDEIYMAPGSRIGAATPILMSPEGGLQNIGEAEREKMNSAMDAIVRSIAQQKGRDAKLATAMVRAESGYTFHGVEIVATNRILTLTNQEAEMRYGPENEAVLSLGTVEDLPGLAGKIGRGGARIIEQKLTGLEEFAKLLSIVGPVLLILASMLLYVEINTPGFGWAGALSISCFALYFFGQNLAGLSGLEEVLLFGIGVLLLLAEVFLLPGFGIAGLAGIAFIIASLFMAMIDRLPPLPGDGWFPSSADIPNLSGALLNMLLVAAGSTGGILLLTAWLPQSRMVQSRLVLGQALPRGSSIPGAPAKPAVGDEGVTSTELRPAGKILCAGQPVDVVADGSFVSCGVRVRIVRIEGARIVVEPLV